MSNRQSNPVIQHETASVSSSTGDLSSPSSSDVEEMSVDHNNGSSASNNSIHSYNLRPKLDSILAQVQSKLPSVEPDSSDSDIDDDDEPIEIFCHPYSSQRGHRESDLLGGLPEAWGDEGDNDEDESNRSTPTPQQPTSSVFIDEGGGGIKSSSNSDNNQQSSTTRTDTPTDNLFTPTDRDGGFHHDNPSSFLPSNMPTLSFKMLEEIDLDVLLDSFGDNEESLRYSSDLMSYASDSVSQSQARRDMESRDVSLLEKLTQLSVRQSRGEFSCSADDKNSPPSNNSPVNEATGISSNSTTTTKSDHKSVHSTTPPHNHREGSVSRPRGVIPLSELTAKSASASTRPYCAMKQDESSFRRTVYLDLRQTDNKKEIQNNANTSGTDVVRRILNLQSNKDQSSSESDDDNDEGDKYRGLLWHERRKLIRQQLTRGVEEVKPKSGSPKPKSGSPKNRPTQNNSVPTESSSCNPISSSSSSSIGVSTTTPPSVSSETEPVDDPPVPEETPKSRWPHQRISRTRKPDQSPLDSHTPGTVVESLDKKLSDDGTQTSVDNLLRQSEIDKESAEKLREEKKRMMSSRQRLKQCVIVQQPQTSFRGGQPAADETPTLFDVDVSYENDCSVLPSLKAACETLLLTVNLVSAGRVAAQKTNSSKSIDPLTAVPGTYVALLTWFLSLTPSDRPDNDAPFRVVGLQQLWLDGQLQLQVAVVPCVSTETMRSIVKSKRSKDLTLFQQAVSKYLCSNTLCSACTAVGSFTGTELPSNINNKHCTQQEGVGDGGVPPPPIGSVYIPARPFVTNKPLSTFVTTHTGDNSVNKLFDKTSGFHWMTVDLDESRSDKPAVITCDTQNTVSLIDGSLLGDSEAVLGILLRVVQLGLDVAGIRLVYASQQTVKKSLQGLNLNFGSGSGLGLGSPCDEVKIVALALRGTAARSVWLEAVGPNDPRLARVTDPHSLMALHATDSTPIFTPRNESRIHIELCKWFGARVPVSGVVEVGRSLEVINRASKRSKKQAVQESSGDASTPRLRPAAPLVATTECDIILICSPLIPPRVTGFILSVCLNQGYSVCGVRRSRLLPRHSSTLGLTNQQSNVFIHDNANHNIICRKHNFTFSPPPSLLLHLRKENGITQIAALLENMMVRLQQQGLLAELQDGCPTCDLVPSLCFHPQLYSDSLLSSLGGDFNSVPDSDCRQKALSYIGRFNNSGPGLEQIAVLTLTGSKMKRVGEVLGKILGVSFTNSTKTAKLQNFELIGLKLLPSLSSQQAQELTPYEIGDLHWNRSIAAMVTGPAMVVVIRGLNVFEELRELLDIPTVGYSPPKSASFAQLMSTSSELSYKQVTLFFSDKELFADPSSRQTLPYLPTPHFLSMILDPSIKFIPSSANNQSTHINNESIYTTTLIGPLQLTTILIVKPDANRRHLARILKHIAREGFTVVAMRSMLLSDVEAKGVVSREDSNRQSDSDRLASLQLKCLTEQPVTVMALKGENAIKKLLDLLGPSDPAKARKLNQCYWRAVFGKDPIDNGLYGSVSYRSAICDLNLFFPHGLSCKSIRELDIENIKCPAVDSICNLKHSKKRTFRVSAPNLSPSSILNKSSNSSSQQTVDKSVISTGVSTLSTPLLWGALCETTCLILPPPLLTMVSSTCNPGYAEIFDWLLGNKGFTVSGLRQVWLTDEQAYHFCVNLLSVDNLTLVRLLCSGPSIVVGLQRDGAVSCFDVFLGSPNQPDSIYSRYSQQILRPKSIRQAAKLLEYFFNELLPKSHGEIVCEDFTSIHSNHHQITDMVIDDLEQIP